MEENVEKSVKSKGNKRGSKSKEKKVVKRSRQSSSNVNENAGKSIPIFTDEFLHLFRKQKSEIRSLKLNYSQLSERLKLKDAEQEQIRLDNQKMRLDIEEISQRNSLLNNQIEQFEKEFHNVFQEEINSKLLSSLQHHSNDQHYQDQIKQIHKNLQL